MTFDSDSETRATWGGWIATTYPATASSEVRVKVFGMDNPPRTPLRC